MASREGKRRCAVGKKGRRNHQRWSLGDDFSWIRQTAVMWDREAAFRGEMREKQ